MSYLAPTFARTENIIARAEGGEPAEGNDLGTNKVFGTIKRLDQNKHAKAQFH
eukprot:CAMPEP_0113689246 /NCGR_PEP_ID=MMETSP0038_2-20120614/17038_1 /TAXON_ID=2898 /ORGANISM="Cryptomonas paramecium" /LENGTH=52 /DNA_ID=CAMNT_0000610257 /DNA_START=141 /DNA_END=299 /DNA_ORIENTATION=+ /assembly_acc=CAM_ASM_000170